MKNIWIMNHYATGMFVQQAGRHYSFAKELKKLGYEPTIFAASTFHNNADPIKTGFHLYTEKTAADNFQYVFVKTNRYVGNGISRIINMLLFAINLCLTCALYARKHPKPDVIYASSVHPFTCVVGILLAKWFSVKCVCEVRDLWPLSLVELGIASEKNIAIRALYRLEKWIYTKADRLIFTMEGGAEYIRDKKWDTEHGGSIDLKKVFHINNGVDLEFFDYNKEHYQIHDEDLENEDVFKVIFSGSMRESDDVIIFVDIAKKLQELNLPIKILLWGQGSEVENIKNKILKYKLENIAYKGFVEKKYIPYILSRSNINIFPLPYKSSLYKYGISLNKSFDYLASGKPLLIWGYTGYSMIDTFKCGLHITNNDSQEKINSIIKLYTDNSFYQRCSINSKKASFNYDFSYLTTKLEKILIR